MAEPGTVIYCPHCKAMVYRLRARVMPGDALSAEAVERVDGTPVKPQDRIECPACGRGFMPSIVMP